MTTHPRWTDEYWLPLMKLYMRRPEGVKPMYSRATVALSLELHIPPQTLYQQMFRIRRPDTELLRRLTARYSANPKRLSRDVKTLRRMQGMGSGGSFYDGVEVRETFERDFRPIPSRPDLQPVMLILTLDLYFRLTPATMVRETPEVAELARLMRLKAQTVVEMLDAFQECDPYLNRAPKADKALADACHDVWQRYGNDEPETLAALAAQMREYFK